MKNKKSVQSRYQKLDVWLGNRYLFEYLF